MLADYYDPNPLQTAKSLMSNKRKFSLHCRSLSGIERNNLENALLENVLTEDDLISLYLEKGNPTFIFSIALLHAAGICKAVSKSLERSSRSRKRAGRKA